jgi:hypothetical protein
MSALFANRGYRPMPVRFLTHRASGLRLLTIDKNCLVHNAARLAAGVAEAAHDSWALLIARSHVVQRSLGRMSGAIPSLRALTRGFARGLGVTGRLPAKGARDVVLEEARDVALDGFARVIKEISPRRERH